MILLALCKRSMSSVWNPQEKKKLACERDHYAKGKHDKGFRRAWPVKKGKASQAFRPASDTFTDLRQSRRLEFVNRKS